MRALRRIQLPPDLKYWGKASSRQQCKGKELRSQLLVLDAGIEAYPACLLTSDIRAKSLQGCSELICLEQASGILPSHRTTGSAEYKGKEVCSQSTFPMPALRRTQLPLDFKQHSCCRG